MKRRRVLFFSSSTREKHEKNKTYDRKILKQPYKRRRDDDNIRTAATCSVKSRTDALKGGLSDGKGSDECAGTSFANHIVPFFYEM